ncbi:hypothetical protein pb186bvf_002222 [Paramecium bursaria]
MNSSMQLKESQHQEKTKGQRTKQDAIRGFTEEVNKARSLLIDGMYGQASDKAQKALVDYKEDLGGESSVLLLPGYFVAAESQIHEQQLKKAENFLVAAYWNHVRYNKPKDKTLEEDNKQQDDITDDQNTAYGGQLHKIFSKLHMAQKDYNKAIDELKLGIFIDSVKYGPEHVITGLNYYYMGTIFQHKKLLSEAESFYGKTSEIWYRFLKQYYKNPGRYQDSRPDEVTVKEASQILNKIEVYFEKYNEENGRKLYLIPITKNYQAQALLWKFQGDENKFRTYMGLAYQELLKQKGEKDKKTKKIILVIIMINYFLDQDDQKIQLSNTVDEKAKINKQYIGRMMRPHTQIYKDSITDLQSQLNEFDNGIQEYRDYRTLPASKQQIKRVLSETYKFTQYPDNPQLSSQTNLRTGYLHVDNLYKDPNKKLPSTRAEIMEMALSNKIIQKEQRKVVRADDLKKKRAIIQTIQQKINYDDQKKKKVSQHQPKIVQQKNNFIGSFTLNMIADLRNKFFNELVSQDADEKFKRIKEIQDDYIPKQVNSYKKGIMADQKDKLKHDLLSKKSQFNSYYQLLALEKSMRKLVALKLKPEIKSYSRFTGAENYKDYRGIESNVKAYIHQNKYIDQQ